MCVTICLLLNDPPISHISAFSPEMGCAFSLWYTVLGINYSPGYGKWMLFLWYYWGIFTYLLDMDAFSLVLLSHSSTGYGIEFISKAVAHDGERDNAFE